VLLHEHEVNCPTPAEQITAKTVKNAKVVLILQCYYGLNLNYTV
jgi:hypothetical protein